MKKCGFEFLRDEIETVALDETVLSIGNKFIKARKCWNQNEIMGIQAGWFPWFVSSLLSKQ